ncbi:hypothetical protein CDL15_Pgr014223 [Punica granatum]|uniref:Uncharacterized protein n=1 Tax=Punica granatum TaxID=22663 RepID=A0A218WDZ7_PUNGR|nr:hypothetical protein CDL15_Pgr014223 [Punica granatum]PKI33676.1 hypothetical protein CRG98_045922 [Punica granatum]
MDCTSLIGIDRLKSIYRKATRTVSSVALIVNGSIALDGVYERFLERPRRKEKEKEKEKEEEEEKKEKEKKKKVTVTHSGLKQFHG